MDAPMRNVGGKVAFVTGGDSGIGLGIARALLRAGMKVVITYRTKAHLDEALRILEAPTGQLLAINVDVTDRLALAAAAQETVQVFGRVHLLVNNAGVGPLVPLSSATFEDWDWCMGINVNGVFNGIRAFLPHIRAHGEGGHIVSTSSMLGGLIVGPFWGVYSASKFAVVGMMESLRAELLNTNIGVSVFCPAGVSSNIGFSNRNRPPAFAATGASDPNTQAFLQSFNESLLRILESDSEPGVTAWEVGELVLDGIRRNDLYILSHPEYEQAIAERNEALLSSIPRGGCAPSEGRRAIAELVRTPIYANELHRRRRAEPQSQS